MKNGQGRRRLSEGARKTALILHTGTQRQSNRQYTVPTFPLPRRGHALTPPDSHRALALTLQTVNLWCCRPSGGGRGDAGGATVIYFGPVDLPEENGGGSGGGGGGDGDGGWWGSTPEEWGGGDGGGCPALAASVCTHLLCPAYVSEPSCLSAWLSVCMCWLVRVVGFGPIRWCRRGSRGLLPC